MHAPWLGSEGGWGGGGEEEPTSVRQLPAVISLRQLCAVISLRQLCAVISLRQLCAVSLRQLDTVSFLNFDF